MSKRKPLVLRRVSLPQLAVTALIFLGAGANTHIDAANTSRVVNVALPNSMTKPRLAQLPAPDNMQVLSPKDADLYRAAFAAQTENDWATADIAIAGLKDHRLMGHVLADRYQRRGASAAEAQTWLAAYGDLPEAADIYVEVRRNKDGKDIVWAKPAPVDDWTGSGYGTPSGFQTEVWDGGASRTLWTKGLRAWRQGDIGLAADHFTKLATQKGLSAWDRAAAEFWAYRALKRSGQTTEAYYWLRQSAENPHTFYGLLANSLLGRKNSWSWQMPELTNRRQAALTSHTAGWRALALVQIGKVDLAEAELSRLNPQGRHALQEAMLAVAEASHMPSLALKVGGIAVNDNGKPYDAALYPLPPWQPAQGFVVDRALLYALMRHESQFDTQAVSDRGACGLMQLMPTTARQIANDNRMKDCSERLLDPATNVALGQGYVRRLASQPMIGDNLLLLLAAYNSGPNRISHWLNESVKRDPLLFIESLPVRETRDYVQQVFIHYATYRARLGQPVDALEQLARGEWPRYALHDGAPSLPALHEAKIKGIRLASNDDAD